MTHVDLIEKLLKYAPHYSLLLHVLKFSPILPPQRPPKPLFTNHMPTPLAKAFANKAQVQPRGAR